MTAIREYRIKKGISQAQLAKLMENVCDLRTDPSKRRRISLIFDFRPCGKPAPVCLGRTSCQNWRKF